MDLFTLDEEIPQIIVSDYDAAKDDQQRSDSLVESTSTVEGNTKQADRTSDSEEVAQSPRLNASLPVDMPDVELNQMWFAERARL